MDLVGSIRNQVGFFARFRRAWSSFTVLHERIDRFSDVGLPASASSAAVGDEPDLRSFIVSRDVARRGSSILATVLYEEYCVWCEEVGIQPIALPTFGRELGEFGVQKVKKADGVQYVNIDLSPKHIWGATGRFLGPETDVGKFYREQVVGVEGHTLSATALYEAYSDWCETRGREPLALPTFGREIAEFGIQKVKKKDGVRYVGIALKGGHAPLG